MHYYEVAPTKIIRPDSQTYTYSYDQALIVGQIVMIEVGRSKMPGVVVRKTSEPAYQTKPIVSLVDQASLPLPLLELSLWLSDYYATHLATVFQTILPRGVQKARRAKDITPRRLTRKRTNFVLNDNQSRALDSIRNENNKTILLHGVTGSGKTAVYIEAARAIIEQNKSVIILVPEISLTPQLVDEFAINFQNVVVTHSRQTESERHLTWQQVNKATSPQIVIGPRSALFLPLKDVGLIVIDEAHEPSYKQEQSPRYSALRAASMLAKYHGAKLILGSATPLVSDYYLAEKTNSPIIEMATTARTSQPPNVRLVNMTKRDNFHRHRFLSDTLLFEIEQTLAQNKQVLLFHNRRGSASTTLCDNCGWQAICPRCFVPMALHADKHELRCHVCGITDKVPTSCPVCAHTNIIHKGIGTKLIESEIAKIFPKAAIGRFDGDSNTDETLDSKYTELYDGKIDIIIGTQIVAKGLDLPHLRTVGVIQADAGLSLPDYSSSERTFQLLAQVVGRVGRSEHASSVIVQTYQPTHPAIIDGIKQDYAAFYQKTIEERNRASFPPFVFLLKLVCIYKTEEAAIRNAQKLAKTLRNNIANIEVLGPTPSFYERQRDTYRWQLVVKAKHRSHLIEVLQHVPSTHWQFELDPSTLL